MPSVTTYDDIYSKFGKKIQDFELAELLQSEDEDTKAFVADMLLGFLDSSIAKFKKCKNDLSDRNDEELTFNIGLEDIEKEILAIMMVSEWLEPQLNSTLVTAQFFGGSEQKFFAQSNQLDKIMVLEKNNDLKARKLMRDYTYRNAAELLG